MILFQDDDLGYATWVDENPEGYVVNIQRSLTASDARMHRASCRHITRAIDAAQFGERNATTTYIKVCSRSVDRLDEWSAQRVGVQIRRCPSCWNVVQATDEPSVRPSAVTSPAGTGLPGDRYKIRVSSGEITLDAVRYLPFERLDTSNCTHEPNSAPHWPG